MGTFACYYNEFTDKSVSDLDLQKELLKVGHSNTQNSAKIKVKNARYIINRSKGVEALRCVANASEKKVAHDGVNIARKTLIQLGERGK
ncbi:MAG: hypothetical protein HOC17_02645 [Candidatus Ruthia sp.]|nr:hypothetical protein [Candidatus Ruthturnera sp.]